MKRCLFLILCFSFSAFSQVIQFSTPILVDDQGVEAYTEVMVSEVSKETLTETSEMMMSFLGLPAKVPSQFIHATFSEDELSKREFANALNADSLLQSAPNYFSEVQNIELPSEWLDSFSGRSPAQEDTEFKRLEKEFDEYYRKAFRKRRLTLIASRTIVNGTVASLGFIAGHVPVSSAIVLGSLTGFLSGALQVHAKNFNDYLATNKFSLKFKKLLGMQANGEIKKSNFLMTHLKWFSMEATFLTLLEVTRFSLGLLPDTGLGQEALNISFTASKSLLSQGALDTSVAKELNPKLREAILSENFELASKLRFRAEMINFTSSITWAGAAVSDLMGLPVGNYLFIGMGGVGGINHARLLLQDKGNKIHDSMKKAYTCSKNFFRLDNK